MIDKPMSNSNGCLWVFISIVCTVIGYGVIKVVTGISDVIALVIAIIVSLVLCVKILGKPSVKVILRQGLFIFLILFGIKLIGGFLLNLILNFEVEKISLTNEDIVTNDLLIEENDTIPVFTSARIWNDNYGNRFSGSLSVRQRDYLRLKNQIHDFNPPSNENFWGNLYDYFEQNDTSSLDLVLETFRKINDEKNLNQMEFAEMVVSCIQDIPYSFVFQEECLPANSYDDSIKRILEDCPECCLGNIPYGIQNPVSFIQNLKGDCDTRTVLIYSILKYFKYDIAILNSDFYRHSILGINLPTSGLNKVYNGKKYVVWETTAKYFEPGILPASFSDLNHWNIILTSK